MKQVLEFFTSSMASAPIKVPDVDAVSSGSNKSNHPFPLSTIEETRDEDELENSLVKVEEEAREEASKTARYLGRKQDTVKPSKDEASASASAATPSTAEETNSSKGSSKGLGLKQKVLSFRKGRGLLRRKNGNSPVLSNGSLTTPNDGKSQSYGQKKQQKPKRNQRTTFQSRRGWLR